MKQLYPLPILFALILLFLAPGPAAAELIQESAEIPYQISNSDRIVIGTVSDIQLHYDYTIFTITVEEWLYNPMPTETIKVRTENGKYVWTEDQPEFEENEEVLLMLKDIDLEDRLFKVSVEFPGKRPVSDRDAVIEELKVQGKWQEGNETSEDGTAGVQEEGDTGSVPESESTPFVSSLWVLAAVIGAVFVFRKKK